MNTGISDSEYYFKMRCICKWYHYQTKKGKFNSGRMNDVSIIVSSKDRKVVGIYLGWVGPMTSEKVLQTHPKVKRDIGYYG